MSDYTAKEVEVAASPLDFTSLSKKDNGHEVAVIIRGEATFAEKADGKAGDYDDEEAWLVLKVGDQLFKTEGYYSSYGNGVSTWESDFTEVRATTKSVAVYEAK